MAHEPTTIPDPTPQFTVGQSVIYVIPAHKHRREVQLRATVMRITDKRIVIRPDGQTPRCHRNVLASSLRVHGEAP